MGLHPTTLQVLQNILKNERLAHAYLFYGKGTNKNEAAIQFAKTINCERNHLDACSECPTCKMIEHGNHPDVISIQPEGTNIKIDTLRTLRKQFHYQAPTGITRFVIIEQAEKMRVEAANSVLKLLEEPPPSMILILITDRVQSILPTIQSRCQKVRFFPQPFQERKNHYQQRGYPEPLATIAAQLDDELSLSAEEFEQLIHQSILLAEQILSDSIDEALLTVLNGEHMEPSILLDVLLFWLREIAYFQSTGTHHDFTSWHSTLVQQSAKQEKQVVLLAIENVMIARRLLSKSVLKPLSVLEQMLLAINRRELSQENGWQLIIL